MTRGIALAVLGDPLAYTCSPALHRAGLSSIGLFGTSAAMRTAPEALPERLRELATHGFRGANLTTPLKHAVMAHLDRVSEPSRKARSVNTVGFEGDGWWGDTTDGPGFIDLLATFGRDPAGERVWILGGGGAARSVAFSLVEAGASVTTYVRRVEERRADWEDISGATLRPWSSLAEDSDEDVSMVVNATPLDAPVRLEALPRRALIIDLRYGPKLHAWVRAARADGREAYDGLGLLVFQARRSLALWFSRPVPVDSLARAVGWPR
jgi:shikimate dehydrogenase